jgi:hypothetical protein
MKSCSEALTIYLVILSVTCQCQNTYEIYHKDRILEHVIKHIRLNWKKLCVPIQCIVHYFEKCSNWQPPWWISDSNILCAAKRLINLGKSDYHGNKLTSNCSATFEPPFMCKLHSIIGQCHCLRPAQVQHGEYQSSASQPSDLHL